VIPYDRGLRGFLRAAARLQRRGYRDGVLLSAAFSAAWLFRCGGVARLRGTGTDGRGLLLADPVDARTLRGMHRVDAFRLLMGQSPSAPPPAHPVRPPAERIAQWRRRLSEPTDGGRLIGLFPGANAPARRWPAERFADLSRALADDGARLVVLGGAGERALTGRVAASTPRATDLGGRTDVVDLAAILSLCDLVVTNDTGPMHLAGAVGAPTVSLWGSSDPAEVRQAGAPDTPVTGPPLPCKPCYRNHCHRRGRGTLLADAHEECMRLIEVRDVVRATEASPGETRA
jgi:heptosyltransferase-2